MSAAIREIIETVGADHCADDGLADAILAALEAEGFVVARSEPTLEMLDAASRIGVEAAPARWLWAAMRGAAKPDPGAAAMREGEL